MDVPVICGTWIETQVLIWRLSMACDLRCELRQVESLPLRSLLQSHGLRLHRLRLRCRTVRRLRLNFGGSDLRRYVEDGRCLKGVGSELLEAINGNEWQLVGMLER